MFGIIIIEDGSFESLKRTHERNKLTIGNDWSQFFSWQIHHALMMMMIDDNDDDDD